MHTAVGRLVVNFLQEKNNFCWIAVGIPKILLDISSVYNANANKNCV